MEGPNTGHRLLRMTDLEDIFGLKKSALFERIAVGTLVKPVQIGPRASRYPSAEVAAVLAAHRAGLSDDRIKLLVSKLHVERAAAAAALEV